MTVNVPKNVYVGKQSGGQKWSLPLLTMLLLGATILFSLSQVWRSGLIVRNITVEGNQSLTEGQILKLAEITLPVRQSDLDLMVVASRIEGHAFVERAILSRDFPSKVRILIVERQPVAMLTGGEPVFVDKDLRVLPGIQSKEIFDLPVITGWRGNATVGAVVESEPLRRAVDVVELAQRVDENLYHLISEVKLLKNGDFILYTSDFGVPVLFGRGDEAWKLVYLQEFWNQVVGREGAANLLSVDLRFEGQVVARWDKREGRARNGDSSTL